MNNRKNFFKVTLLIGLVLTSMTYVSCRRDVPLKDAILSLPGNPYNYSEVNVRGNTVNIPQLITDDSKSAFSDHSATLGRVLFYDTKMSINNSVSCGTCHKQELAFADGSKFSTGFANKQTTRNSMAILNPVENNKMFWDSRAETPYDLSLMPVFNHLEMGMESDEMLVEKISEASYYPELFEKAFGSSEVTKDKISLAVSAFINSMFSKDSKFDQGQITEFANFNEEEKMGMSLFNSAKMMCSACHAADNFNSQQYYNHFSNVSGTANIGLDKVYSDNGADRGSFKIPNLRNAALTGPYMHDGRYATLEEVINHYANGIQDNDQLDPRFRESDGSVKRIPMTEVEKNALVAFLKTLTDESFITDEKFSDPFK